MKKEIASRFLDWMQGKKRGPVKIQINPTNRCNLKCRFCWLRDFDEAEVNLEEIETSRYLGLVKEAKDLGVRKFEITGGGEPLMRKDVIEIMKEIKEAGMEGELITNGTLFEEEDITQIIEMGWDRILFSLDAPDKETNDFLRGGGFEKVVWSIRRFVEIEKKKGVDKPEIAIHTVLCKANYEKLPRMVEFVYGLGVRNFFVEPMVFLTHKTGAGKELLLDKGKEVEDYIRKAEKLCSRYGIKHNLGKLKTEQIEHVNRMDRLLRKKAYIPCFQPWYHVVIRPWGSVGPCCMFDYSEENIKQKSLKQIWFGDYFERIRKSIMEGNLFGFCSNCNPSQVQENEEVRMEIEKMLGKSMRILEAIQKLRDVFGV